MKLSRIATLLPLALLGLAACHSGNTMDTLVANSNLTRDILDVYGRIFWWTLILFVLVQGGLLYIAFRFRARAGDDTLPEQVHGNATLEMAWTVLPVLILVHIAVPTVDFVFKSQAPASADALLINAIGKQWWFDFEYPQSGVRTGNEIHVPLGKEVSVRLQSDNVIHSFWVPQLMAKRDMVPGRVNVIKFTAEKVGTYLGQCAEYCGDSHALMRFRVVVDTPEDFQKWLDAQSAPVAETLAVGEGADLFKANCVACHRIRGVSEAAQIGTAPDLTHVASRSTIASGILDNTPENLKKWISDAPSVKPGSKMVSFTQVQPPAQALTEAQVAALVSYLQSLK